MPETAWGVAKFHELEVALDWLESSRRYPAACVTPPILCEAAKYLGFLSKELARLEGMIADKAVSGRISDFLKDPKLSRARAIEAHLERELSRWSCFLNEIKCDPLTAEQRRAVLTEEDATLVLAGAGLTCH